MRFSVSVLSLPVPEKGHDALAFRDDLVAIADGSTPLVDREQTDARAYAERALSLLALERRDSIRETFGAALRRADQAEFVEMGASCTVGLVRTGRAGIEAAVLGDCLIVASDRDGGTSVITDRRLDGFDGAAASELAKSLAEGASETEARKAINSTLIANRRAANRPDSYWIFAGDPAAADEVLSARLPPETTRAILLCSDGFSRLIDPMCIVEDEAALMRAALTEGLHRLGQELRAAENAPGSLVRAPRLGSSDDATAVLLQRI